MREEQSAGGVVLLGNAILLLRKYNGDWVLPKGKIESGESHEEAKGSKRGNWRKGQYR